MSPYGAGWRNNTAVGPPVPRGGRSQSESFAFWWGRDITKGTMHAMATMDTRDATDTTDNMDTVDTTDTVDAMDTKGAMDTVDTRGPRGCKRMPHGYPVPHRGHCAMLHRQCNWALVQWPIFPRHTVP